MCFRTANKNLKDSNTYKQCQKSLLLTETDMIKSHLRVLQKGFSFLRKELQSNLNSIDFAHICSLFLSGNEFCEISKNIFSIEHLQTTASGEHHK